MNNPYKTSFMSALPVLDMNVNTQIDRYREEERAQKAPDIYPYTVDSVEERLSQIYGILRELHKTVESTRQEPKINNQALDTIEAIIQDISRKILIDIPAQVDKLKL
jgi:uncharacterized membrane protein YheB (UPF0754 family)